MIDVSDSSYWSEHSKAVLQGFFEYRVLENAGWKDENSDIIAVFKNLGHC